MKNEEEKEVVEAEPDFQELKNPSRVLAAQEKTINYPREGRYIPVL